MFDLIIDNDIEKELLVYEDRKDNIAGICSIISRTKDPILSKKLFIKYLRGNNIKDRDSLFRYAYKLLGKEIKY